MDELGFPLEEDYVAKQIHFCDEDEIPEVVVWVEAHVDSRLWMPLFNNFPKFRFVFKPASIFPGVDDKSSNGCDRLLSLLGSGQATLGKHQIFCLDSDFKYIAGLADDFAGVVSADPFIFWTMVHSKENIYSSATLVDDVISHLLGVPVNNLLQSSTEIFQTISESIYSSYTRVLYLESIYWGRTVSKFELFRKAMDDALDTLKRKPIGEPIVFDGCAVWREFEQRLSSLHQEIDDYLKSENLEESYARYIEKIKAAGISPTNLYFFIRGHDWESLVKELSCKRMEFYRRNMIGEIKRYASKDNSQKIAEYINGMGNFIGTLAARAPRYDEIPFFHKTIDRAIATYL